ncbi:hypothetical protein BH10PAT1_BH10PAT1_6650 [soil metagenome]
MERLNLSVTDKRAAFIQANYAEKKGRGVGLKSNMTCYISIDSPFPNLPYTTALMLEELSLNKDDAFIWTRDWDKSIISVAPDNKLRCDFLEDSDLKRKTFAPVSTTKVTDVQQLLNDLPQGELAVIKMNSQPTTIDAFLISYFHMVNQLIWDTAIAIERNVNVTRKSYSQALDLVMNRGFSTGIANDTEIIMAQTEDPDVSVRIYGSNVNKFVPQIMGAIIKK